MQVALDGIELRLVRLPLAEPFRTAHGVRHGRDLVLVRAVVSDGPDGWGECVAEPEPTYWPEYTATALDVLEHHLVPRLLAGRPLGEVRGHNMAKAALDCAVVDAGLRAEGRSLAAHLGATRSRVPTGIALGIAPSIEALVTAAARWHGEGHRAFKLKVAPGWHLQPVMAVRQALGDDVVLIVDANGSFRSDRPEDLAALHALDQPALRLAAVEQPFTPDDLVGHGRLARELDTRVCLDESIGSPGDLEVALALGACDAVNLKVGRVGGLDAAARIHQRCRDQGIDVRCGGMLETGVGRALNLAVAALPGCTLPPDLAPSAKYFSEDLTVPFEAQDGTMNVPGGPGLGVEPRPDVLDRVTVRRQMLRADA